MKKRYKFSCFIFFIFGCNIVCSQARIPLYKMVMNSDIILIVESKDYQYITKQNNEYYTDNWINFPNTFNVLKNRYNQKLKNFTSKIETDNNDFYLSINGESCAGIGNILEREKKYYNIFFLKRKEKKYFVIAHLWNNILTDNLPFFEKNINEVNLISQEKNLECKKEKIEKWFETSNADHPNQYIIESPFTEELNNFFLEN